MCISNMPVISEQSFKLVAKKFTIFSDVTNGQTNRLAEVTLSNDYYYRAIKTKTSSKQNLVFGTTEVAIFAAV